MIEHVHPGNAGSRFLTIEEVAAQLHESPRTTRKRLHAGAIAWYRPAHARRMLVREADFEQFLDRCRVEK